ncbi:RICIN domain-containing protein [Paractinoplanes rishiriensis]|uniref:Ricin B lectin domain-containing protein n=1 Tax=Paractinoplanes rishiriensis TaxID=1050105 RepID=A0A919K531_9ACTN|nr:RICIN domain-containing protein [Actinoplanes rishiriensis]GIE99467.1 hypothetical protein Ari01nite_69320 [Actinoplanes rishiriensis]
MRFLRGLLVAVLLATGLVTVVGSPAQAAIWVYYGRYELRNSYTGTCLDAHFNGGGLNGNRVGLWQCNGGISTQWDLYENIDAVDYRFQLVNARTPTDNSQRRCLDYPANSGGANGFQYLLWDCVNSSGQKFRRDYNADLGAYIFAVMLGGPHNHIDAFASGGLGNGSPVGNWAWTGHPLQHWELWPV